MKVSDNRLEPCLRAALSQAIAAIRNEYETETDSAYMNGERYVLEKAVPALRSVSYSYGIIAIAWGAED